ncbi:T9SS type A sorting domain-containing protein [Pontibacter korlensis]|uniref:Fibronectin type-III domain-containing protein n=1 Tax=Pontibacter korlensis TaxID=400092 RepID=A0A0E3ZFL0_9BACT|nr:T9SS type A sorting domain-containing protein [Pontibacter korlensis]AKD04345.1 hypothetical protein PKOR_16180 [Pontibacter korlensis]
MRHFYRSHAYRHGLLALALALLLPLLAVAQTKEPYRLSGGNYTERYDAIAAWAADFASGQGAAPYQAATPSPVLPSQNKVFSSGTGSGVQKGSESIVLLATGSTDGQNAAAFDLLLDFSGTRAGILSLDWASVSNSTGNRKATFSIQANTGADGTFEELAGTTVEITNNDPTNGALTSIALPSAFDGKADARLRFFLITSSGGTTGSRPKMSLDNLVITSTPTEGEPGTTDPGTTAPAVALSKTSLPDFGQVEVGAVSAGQSFTVSGENLSGDITITPAAGFEIRVGDNAFACCAITLGPEEGSLASTTVEVRFAPGAAEAFTGSIEVSGGGDEAQAVAVTGTGIAALYPATLTSATVTEITTSSAVAGGTIASDGGSEVTARGVVWSTEVNPTTADSKTADGTGSGAFTSTISGLMHSTVYYVRAYATNAVGTVYGQERTFTTAAVQLAAEPTTAPEIAISEVTGASLLLTLSGGDGAKRLVLARQGAAVDASPADGTAYAANATFRQGQEVGTGNFVVYNGTGTEVEVTGLRGASEYHFAVFAYNDNDTEFAQNYLTTAVGRASATTPEAAGFVAFEENFNYAAGELLTDNGWAAHSGGSTNAIAVASEGLSYEGYPSSGIGNSASFTASGQDVNRSFEAIGPGTPVYASFLVNVATASSGGDYFLHLGPSSLGTTFRNRVYVRASSEGKVQFGISGSGSEQAYTTTEYNVNTTYLLVTKYVFDETGTTATLYVNPAGTEPAAGQAELAEGADKSPSDIGTIALRQGSGSPVLTIDGIRVATDYSLLLGVEACQAPATPTVAAQGMELTVTNPAEGTVSYQWYLNGTAIEGATGISYTATEAGSYSVIALAGECSSEASAAQEVTVTGIQDKLLKKGVAVYPVPATDRLRIQAGETGQGTATIRLYDLLGRQVLTRQARTSGELDIVLEVRSLRRGTYVLVVETPQGFITRKVMLQ